VHTGYSFLDGFCDIKKLVARVKELDHPAVAITDHGNMHGVIDFYKECRAQGIHPVLGCEVYFALDRTMRKKDTKLIRDIIEQFELEKIKLEDKPEEDEPKKKGKSRKKKLDLISNRGMDEIIKAVQKHPERVEEILKPYVGEERYQELFWAIDSLGLDNYHLVLLVKNEEGLRNLYRIITDANVNGFYYKPRTDLSVLKKYGRGLIGLSACLAGRVPYLLLAGFSEQAKQLTLELADCLDEFYLEIQPNSLPAQAIANNRLIDLARDLKIPLVATCDSHYILKEDHEAHDLLLCIQTNKELKDEDRLRFTNDFWVKTEEEVRAGLAYLDEEAVAEAVENTVKVAEKCNVSLEFGKLKFPVYSPPGGQTPEDYLKKLCKRNLLSYSLSEEGFDINFKKYQKQLNYELDVICNAGFAPYFLITQDFINWAQKNNILTGPGRGSAAGSLVTYLLGITNLDPIKFNLSFERSV